MAKIGSVLVTEQDVQREIEKRIPMQVSFHGGMKPEKLEKIRNEAKDDADHTGLQDSICSG